MLIRVDNVELRTRIENSPFLKNHRKCQQGINCKGPGCRYSKPKRVQRQRALKPLEEL